LDASGRPVVSYVARDGLKVLRCGDLACATITSLASLAPHVGSDLSMALDSAGKPVISFYDYRSQDLNFIHCGDVTCTSSLSFATLDSVGDVGIGNSIALDLSGNPIVSYQDSTNLDLKLLRCGDPACSAP
jgi:hypothetical protein